MSFSAKRSAYSDMPSFSSQSAICCIAAPNRISRCLRFGSRHTEFILPVARLKGAFWWA